MCAWSYCPFPGVTSLMASVWVFTLDFLLFLAPACIKFRVAVGTSSDPLSWVEINNLHHAPIVTQYTYGFFGTLSEMLVCACGGVLGVGLWEGRVLCASRINEQDLQKESPYVCVFGCAARVHVVVSLGVTHRVPRRCDLLSLAHHVACVWFVLWCAGLWLRHVCRRRTLREWWQRVIHSLCVRVLRTIDFPSSPLSPLPVPPFVKFLSADPRGLDVYRHDVRRVGGMGRSVILSSPSFSFRHSTLHSAVSTRWVVLAHSVLLASAASRVHGVVVAHLHASAVSRFSSCAVPPPLPLGCC